MSKETRYQWNGANQTTIADYGDIPFVINIEQTTASNPYFRTTFWTGKHLQMTLMSIDPGEEIGIENHPDIDQFLSIEEGYGLVKMGYNQQNLHFQRRVMDGYGIFIPAGTWHNLINMGPFPLKLYSVYAPTQHPKGTVHRTKDEAMQSEIKSE